MATFARPGNLQVISGFGGSPVSPQPDNLDSETHYGVVVRVTHPSGATEEKHWHPLTSTARPKALTRFEFLNLFTGEEIDAALALKATTLARFWLFYEAASQYERDHPSTGAGLDALVAYEVIDAERKAEILADWPSI